MRLDGLNATYPFATLSANSQELRVTGLGREYVFPKLSINKLSRHRGWFSLGLRIEHTVQTYPTFVVFWTSVLLWTSGFQRLRDQLKALGYVVAD